MNPTSKRFISLFLVFALMMLSVNLYAKERRGATLVITKKDRQQIDGELITVKIPQQSLLLLDSKTGADVSVGIKDIDVITIVGKSNAETGAVVGFLVGVVPNIFLGKWLIEEHGASIVDLAPAIVIFCGVGAALGALVGKQIKTNKTIQIEGKSDLEITKILAKLRKYARIRDYK